MHLQVVNKYGKPNTNINYTLLIHQHKEKDLNGILYMDIS